MLNKDYTTKLLNLEDVKITNAKSEIESIHVYLELPRKEYLCPACGATTSLVHDYREQVVKDVKIIITGNAILRIFIDNQIRKRKLLAHGLTKTTAYTGNNFLRARRRSIGFPQCIDKLLCGKTALIFQ